jgi:Protein of unknown function (DUF3027)
LLATAAGTGRHAGELVNVSPATLRGPVLDQICADATDLARRALEDVVGASQVGPHLGVAAEADRVVSHLFRCEDPAYAGWQWTVTVARAARSRTVTVCESELLPGPGALLAPPWVPWSERVRPGDLGVGDLMPASSDDERLVPVVAIEGADGLLDWDDSPAWLLGAAASTAGQADWTAGSQGAGPGAGPPPGLPAADALPAPAQAMSRQDSAEPSEEADGGAAEPPAEGGPGRAEPSAERGAGLAAPPAEHGAGLAAPPAEDGAGPAAPPAEDGAGPAEPPAERGTVPAEAGPGSARVLSAIGREGAASRWYAIRGGAGAARANRAPAPCVTCGFFVRLSGQLGRVFGVCANEFSPADGRVVGVDYGCGAHSDPALPAGTSYRPALPAVDELGYELSVPAGRVIPDLEMDSLEPDLP